MSAPSPDLAAPSRWQASLRASRERRVVAWRRRRRRFRARTMLLAAVATMLVVSAGVALASNSSANTLKFGMRGTAVKELQRRLHVRPVSGYFGTKTKSAVKRFQSRHGLRADGVAGPATLRKLGMRVNSAGSDTGGTSPGSGGGGGGSHVKVPAELKRIAQCESGGNPRAVSPSGKYRGKYQFDRATWEAWGGRGDPIKNPESTQDRVAVRLYHARGTKPWPNCA
jgi:Transglycosylase-like domain/Putative peptidoglycan binding domain